MWKKRKMILWSEEGTQEKMYVWEKNGKKQEENGRQRNEMVRGGDMKTLMSSSMSFI